MRALVLGLTVLLIGILAAGALLALVTGGPGPLEIVSAIVIAIVGFGVLGALSTPPR